MKKIVYLTIISTWIFLVSCGDFLSEYPKDLIYVNSISDLDELLVGEAYMQTRQSVDEFGDMAIPGWIHVMDDDVEMQMQYGERPQFTSFYCWLERPFQNEYGAPEDDRVWSRLYEHIAALNVILNKVKEFEGDTEGYSRVKGQAHFLRAGYYFLLTNLYAQPYVKETAENVPGVPLKLSDEVEDKLFTRASLEDVYQLLITDLREAIKHLKQVNMTSVYKASEAAAHALLSRVYLYMGDWENAIAESDTVMNAGYGLLDYNQIGNGESTLFADSPETIFSQGEYRLDHIMRDDAAYKCSADLLNAFYDKEHDLRYINNVMGTYSGAFLIRKLKQWKDGGISDCFLIRLAEVYLNKVEALAMSGKETEAAGLLQSYLEKRFVPGSEPTFDRQGKGLVDFIRNERRLELCMEGHRWFDLRRYAVTSKYALKTQIRHQHYIYSSSNYQILNDGYYDLAAFPEDGGWVLPIPSYELIYNGPGLVNNDRPVRTLIKK